MGVRVPRHGLRDGSITISIVHSPFQVLRLPLLWEVLQLRWVTRSTAARRVVLGFFFAPFYFVLLRVGRSSTTASTASPGSCTAMPWLHPHGRTDQLRETTLAPRTMLRHTALPGGAPEVGPRDDGAFA